MSRRVHASAPVILLALCVFVLADDGVPTSQPIERPPKANLHQPVDYYAWFRAQVFDPDWPDGREIYGSLVDRAKQDVWWAQQARTRPIAELLSEASRRPWTRKDIPELAKYLDGIAKPLSEYLAPDLPLDVRWDVQVPSDGAFARPPVSYLQIQALSKAALARAWLKDQALPRQHIRMLTAWRRNLLAARHLRDTQPSSLGVLVSLGLRRHTYDSILAALDAGILDRSAIHQLRQMLEIDVVDHWVDRCIIGEWMWQLDVIQTLYPNGKITSEGFKATFGREPENGDVGLMLFYIIWPPPEVQEQQISNFFEPLLEIAQRPLTLANGQDFESAGGRMEVIAYPGQLVYKLWPSVEFFYSSTLKAEVFRRATQLVINLHEFKDEHGHWPARLSDLELADDVRIDPYSEMEFRYRLQDGEPLLYCVGLDGVDNGGKHGSYWEEGNDWVLYPPQAVD